MLVMSPLGIYEINICFPNSHQSIIISRLTHRNPPHPSFRFPLWCNLFFKFVFIYFYRYPTTSLSITPFQNYATYFSSAIIKIDKTFVYNRMISFLAASMILNIVFYEHLCESVWWCLFTQWISGLCSLAADVCMWTPHTSPILHWPSILGSTSPNAGPPWPRG